jgi:ribosomal protein S19
VNVRNTPRGVSVSTRKEIGSLPAKASEQKGTSQRAKIGQQSKSIRRISVHNGSREVRLERRPERVGFTLGDFAPSRKRSKLQPSTNRTKIVKAAVKATPKKLEHKN